MMSLITYEYSIDDVIIDVMFSHSHTTAQYVCSLCDFLLSFSQARKNTHQASENKKIHMSLFSRERIFMCTTSWISVGSEFRHSRLTKSCIAKSYLPSRNIELFVVNQPMEYIIWLYFLYSMVGCQVGFTTSFKISHLVQH